MLSEFAYLVEPGETEWTVRAPPPDSTPHLAPNPLTDGAFQRDLDLLASSRPVALDHDDSIAAIAVVDLAARRLGVRLTDLLLSADARVSLRERMAGVDGTTRLTIRIGEGPLADAALALPWDLLMPEPDRFAVADAKLAVVRDATRPGAPHVDAPVTALAVAATIAAPEDRPALRYEEEGYRLFKALTSVGAHVAFAELGELDDLAELVHRMNATAVHFSGHAAPDGLVFEDDLGRAQPVTVPRLMARLREYAQSDGAFPRLFYFAVRRADIPVDIHVTAAALHREGFACVIGSVGLVIDPMNTAAEIAFYRALAAGDPLLNAVQQARAALAREYVHDGQRLSHPLGWSRLAVYLRGANQPLTIAPRRTGPRIAPPRLKRKEEVVSGLPVLQHGFIGRRGLLHEINRKLRAGQFLFVLHGLGGLGKTALATHILRKLVAPNAADQLILCVQQETDVSALRTQAEAHGDALKLPDWSTRVKELHDLYPDPCEGFYQTVLILRGHRPDLVIYADNMEALQVGADDPADTTTPALGTWRLGVDRWWHYMELLAQTGVVIASTRYTWKGIPRVSFVSLDPMSPADLWRMVDTMPTLSRLPPQVRERIADTADGRPRTLVLLEGLVAQADEDPTHDFVDAWTEWVEPVLIRHGDKLTEDLLLDQLWRHLSPAARSHAAAITILQQPAPRPVIDALGHVSPELIRTGLLTRHREFLEDPAGAPPTQRDRWFMLAVVRDFARTHGPSIPPGPSARAAAYAYETLPSEPSQADMVETIRLYHVAGDPDAAWPLVRKNAIWLRNRGSYHDALQSLTSSKNLGLNERSRAEYNSILVQFYILTGLNPDAIDLETLIAGLAESSDEIKILKLHPAALFVAHEGKYAEAEVMLRETLALIETSFSGVHPSLNSTVNNLAKVLIEQGRYVEATNIFMNQLVVSGDSAEGTHDPSDQSILLHNIATAFEVQGLYKAAEKAIDVSLMLKEAILGREHPSFGQSLHTRGTILLRQGRIGAAVAVFREVVEVLRTTLGERHYAYGAALSSLASAMEDHGGYPEVDNIRRQAVNLQIETRGKDHPESLVAIQNLAVMLAKHEKFDEAEHLLRTSLAAQDEALGKNHPISGDIRLNLASVLALQGKYDEAQPLLLEASRILQNALGSNHPHYAAFLHNAASIAAKYGDLDRGIALMSTALEIRQRALGPDHPQYSDSLCALAQMLQNHGRTTDAEQQLTSFLTAQEAAHGKDHASLYWPLCHLAAVCASAGQYLNARRLLERSRRIAELHVAPEHDALQHIQQLQRQVDNILTTSRSWRTWTGRRRRPRLPKR